MPVRPVLMSEIRKTGPPSPLDLHRANTGSGSYNRFAPLTARSRTSSLGKRPAEEQPEVSSPKMPRLDANKVFDQLSMHDKELDLAKGAIAAASTAIEAACKPDDNGIGTALHRILEAVQHLVNGSEVLKSVICDTAKQIPENQVNRGGGGGGGGGKGYAAAAASQTGGGGPNNNAKKQLSEEDILANKVKKSLKEAEKKTVIFDLNLGTAPTINRDTLSRKVTIALHDKVSNGSHDWNIQDAGEMVDDLLSCSQLEFLGNGSRKYFNRRNVEDPLNNKMCTVPVRLDFKSKEIRMQAEETLRKVCKVSCSIPYPKRLRDMLTQTIRTGKTQHPDCFIRTRVDSDNLKILASARTGNIWIELPELTTDIPLDILDRNPLYRLTLHSDQTSDQTNSQTGASQSQASL